jgi:hypothetical protein
MMSPASKSLATVLVGAIGVFVGGCGGDDDRRNDMSQPICERAEAAVPADEIPDDAPTLILLLGMSETESFWGLLRDEVIHVTESGVRREQFAALADEYRQAVDNGLDETVASLTRQDDGGWACRAEG